MNEKDKLQANYNNLLEVHMETIKKYENKCIECADLKNEIDLKDGIIELIEKWEKKPK